MSVFKLSKKVGVTLFVLGAAVGTGFSSVAEAETATISGAAFQDMNRDGIRQPDEAAMAGVVIYLLDGARTTFIASTRTDTAGNYRFPSLSDRAYSVEFRPSDWWAIREDWVPTTTGTLLPRLPVTLRGEAVANFGWRPLVRSTNLAAPVSSFTGPSGVRIQSFNDAVTAGDVHAVLTTGTLIEPVSRMTTIRFGYSSSTSCSTSVVQSGGVYKDFLATCNVSYLSWLNGPDNGLFHEYGHAWSLYHAFITQQDPDLSGYLAARGLAGDPRLETSHAWSRREMIAEDYRQLFGSPLAREAAQENRDLPEAEDVAGLLSYLSTAFTQPPGGTGGTGGSDPSGTETPPPPALEISGLRVTPDPLKSTGSVTFSISVPSLVTVEITDDQGRLVAALAKGVPVESSGVIGWDRTDVTGRRARRGVYTARLQASDQYGRSVTAAASFSVA